MIDKVPFKASLIFMYYLNGPKDILTSKKAKKNFMLGYYQEKLKD